MINDQVDPLLDEGDENVSLGNALNRILYYYSFFRRIINNNRVIVSSEDLSRTLLRMLLNRDGEQFLRYLDENKAYTVNVAATRLGLSEKKVHNYTGVLVKTGFLCIAFTVKSGYRGSPVNIYEINGEDDRYAKDAANLYHDLHATYKPEPLESYMLDYDYNQVAEEAIRHLNREGCVGTWTLVNLLSAKKLYGDEPLIAVKRIVKAMGYTVVEGE